MIMKPSIIIDDHGFLFSSRSFTRGAELMEKLEEVPFEIRCSIMVWNMKKGDE